METDIIMASREELKRLHIIRKVMEKQVTQVDAGSLLGISERQVRRVVKRILEGGDGGICHRSRGKLSNRRRNSQEKDRILKLYREQYEGFGPTLASEKLLERQGIEISDETLRLWLKEAGEAYPQRKKKRRHRRWRIRKEHFGEMVQMDGSHHDWLERRGPACVLMGYIDDATGKVFGRFYEYEGTIPAMDSFKRYALKYGIPWSVYVDRHSTYKSPAKATIEDDLVGREPQSQFERALEELGVEVIHALSPQAKGRIERLFGTFQDRVIKEMRLAGIKSIEEANQFLEGYLPVYNQRFGVLPAKKADFHRPVSAQALDRALCIQEKRVVREDNTISYHGQLYQIEDSPRSRKVMVEERLDGSMRITSGGQSLSYHEITNRPQKESEERRPWVNPPLPKPAPTHPWRRSYKGIQPEKT